MNFCMCGIIFVLLAKLKCKLRQHKVEKTWQFLCADMVDFRRPGHICSKLSHNPMQQGQSDHMTGMDNNILKILSAEIL